MATAWGSARAAAESALQQGRAADAVAAYQQFLRQRSDGSAADWFNLGVALRRNAAWEPALQAYDNALARGIEQPEEVLLNRAVILSQCLQRNDEAEVALREALSRRPGWPPALLNLGNLQEERGDAAAAVACYAELDLARLWDSSAANRVDAHADLRGEALARLAQLTPPASLEAPLMRHLGDAAATPGLSPQTVALLHFARGRALDRLGAYEAAMDAFHAANRLAASLGPRYQPERAAAAVQALLAASLPAPSAGVRTESATGAVAGPPLPLFICGQYRSGSTLIEQVLAAHPAVAAGGELDILPRWIGTRLAPFPASLARLEPAAWAQLAHDYRLEQGQRVPHGAQCRYITDKRPDNHLLIGLIKRLFPHARIVHTVRHPLDTAVSIYTQPLAQRRLPYASDLAHIGHQLALHEQVMQAWRQAWGEDLHAFVYDDFVRAPRPTLQALLDFLGLPWDERCLFFHQQHSAVRTASLWQVRQPVYQASSGRWRHYTKHLGPVREALTQARVDWTED